MTTKRYRVTFERDPDSSGWWIVELYGEDGVNSDGRTLEEARRNIREALSLAVGDDAAERAIFDENVVLPRSARDLVAKQEAARCAVEAAAAAATELQTRAADELVNKVGLSLRDAGEILDVSHVMVAKALERKHAKRARVASRR